VATRLDAQSKRLDEIYALLLQRVEASEDDR
jgi:hypothetical protein